LRVRRKAAIIVGAGSLMTAVSGLAALGVSGAAGAAAVTAAPQAVVSIHPNVIRRAQAQAVPPTTADCEAAYDVACYQPAQIEQAYNLPALYDKGITGQGTTIAIVDAFGSPTIQSDLATFDTTFRLPAPPSFTTIQPAGAVPPFNPANSQMLDWADETTLDVEYAHAAAPGANILLVETPVAETEGVAGFPQIVQAEEYVLRHYPVDVISQSFAATEPTFPSLASVQALRGAYLEADLQHVTVLAASGDSGATDVELDGQTFYASPVTSWPGSDPLVTGVGGTQLHLNANGSRTSPDTAWNDTYNLATNRFIDGDNGPNPLASGGGKSVLFGRPVYQDLVRNIVSSSRGVPDISMSAACNGSVDVYQSFPGETAGWYPTCGTSEATPLFAGIVALAAQVAHHPLGLINPALYQLAALKRPGIVPVTSGSNTVSFTQNSHDYTVTGYPAQAGYSLVTGVGTVNGALFVPELAAAAGRELPVAVMNDLAGRAAVGLGDGPQRPVRRVAHAEEEGDLVIAGHAQDLAGRILVADRRMGGADAEVGGGDGHGVGGLPQVVVVEEAGTVVLGARQDEGDGRGRAGDVAGAPPHGGQRPELIRVGDHDEVPVLPVGCRRRPSGCLGDPVEIAGRDGIRPVGPDVAAGADGVPGFHGRVLLSEAYPVFPMGILY
jgi:hypothetical protein